MARAMYVAVAGPIAPSILIKPTCPARSTEGDASQTRHRDRRHKIAPIISRKAENSACPKTI